MSEQQTTLSEAPAEELRDILATKGEVNPATADDFWALQTKFDHLISHHQSTALHQGRRALSSSVFLRQADASEDAPRFRVTTDPYGELNQANNYGQKPTLILNLEQGRKHEYQPGKGKIGSWGMEVAVFFDGDSVQATVMGSTKTGRSAREPLPGSSPHAYAASQELMSWIDNQIGDPETAVPGPTKAEKREQTFMGRIGLGHLVKP